MHPPNPSPPFRTPNLWHFSMKVTANFKGTDKTRVSKSMEEGEGAGGRGQALHFNFKKHLKLVIDSKDNIERQHSMNLFAHVTTQSLFCV